MNNPIHQLDKGQSYFYQDNEHSGSNHFWSAQVCILKPSFAPLSIWVRHLLSNLCLVLLIKEDISDEIKAVNTRRCFCSKWALEIALNQSKTADSVIDVWHISFIFWILEYEFDFVLWTFENALSTGYQLTAGWCDRQWQKDVATAWINSVSALSCSISVRCQM